MNMAHAFGILHALFCFAQLIGEQLEDDDEDVELFWQLDSTNEYLLNAFTNTVLLNFPFLVHLPGYYKSIYKAATDAKTRVLHRYFDKVRVFLLFSLTVFFGISVL